MAVLPIVKVPAPVLRTKTKKVRKIDTSIQKLIDDMIETMHDAPGVGLAANQVGVPLRICVIHVPGDEVAFDWRRVGGLRRGRRREQQEDDQGGGCQAARHPTNVTRNSVGQSLPVMRKVL